jgi:isocitrate dehydrogenase kinase/phosphatase
VHDNGIFPEEFPRFLAFPARARDELTKHHGDLFHPQFWRETQGRLHAGELHKIANREEFLPLPLGKHIAVIREMWTNTRNS